MAEPLETDDIFFTRTMASVLESQGLMEDALVIYKILNGASPGDLSLKEKIKSLKVLAGRRKGSRSGSPGYDPRRPDLGRSGTKS